MSLEYELYQPWSVTASTTSGTTTADTFTIHAQDGIGAPTFTIRGGDAISGGSTGGELTIRPGTGTISSGGAVTWDHVTTDTITIPSFTVVEGDGYDSVDLDFTVHEDTGNVITFDKICTVGHPDLKIGQIRHAQGADLCLRILEEPTATRDTYLTEILHHPTHKLLGTKNPKLDVSEWDANFLLQMTICQPTETVCKECGLTKCSNTGTFEDFDFTCFKCQGQS